MTKNIEQNWRPFNIDSQQQPTNKTAPIASSAYSIPPQQWSQNVKMARLHWSMLREDELLRSEGNFCQLASLVKKRYGISYESAKRQVLNFLAILS